METLLKVSSNGYESLIFKILFNLVFFVFVSFVCLFSFIFSHLVFKQFHQAFGKAVAQIQNKGTWLCRLWIRVSSLLIWFNVTVMLGP